MSSGWSDRARAKESNSPPQFPPRHGEIVDQVRSASFAQAVDLSVWHEVQGFGILKSSVIFGVMNANV